MQYHITGKLFLLATQGQWFNNGTNWWARTALKWKYFWKTHQTASLKRTLPYCKQERFNLRKFTIIGCDLKSEVWNSRLQLSKATNIVYQTTLSVTIHFRFLHSVKTGTSTVVPVGIMASLSSSAQGDTERNCLVASSCHHHRQRQATVPSSFSWLVQSYCTYCDHLWCDKSETLPEDYGWEQIWSHV